MSAQMRLAIAAATQAGSTTATTTTTTASGSDIDVDTRSANPTALATSHEIRDRGSTFVGYVYRAQTVGEAKAALRHHAGERGDSGCHHVGKHTHRNQDQEKGEKGENEDEDEGQGKKRGKDGNGIHRVDGRDGLGPYAIAAWRCMAVKPGRTGLCGPEDFVVVDGYEDGGERWAGGRVLRAMQREGVIDAVVIVCRWFGGTLLGPVRFAHVETCASEVCRKFRKMEEMGECIQTLRTLDDLLATLRTKLATARKEAAMQGENTAENARAKREPDYRTMQDMQDLTKAKRLIHARECAIKTTKMLIDRHTSST